MTKDCVTAAADLLANLDENVDPCDNFYEFACGGFIENKVIPDDKSKYSSFSVLNDKLNEQVKYLLHKTSFLTQIFRSVGCWEERS